MPVRVGSSEGLGVTVFALVLKQPLRQLDTIATRYGEHCALGEAPVDLPRCVADLPIFYVTERASI